ncbi:acyl-CoA thioester hydrolase [Aequitasia blattaphilus]|nr:thioesterase family protein [Aequitasia blattaphilus]
MDNHIYEHKVQYYETDQMGVVHHSNYIRWFEEARTDYMEKLGLGYETMEDEGIMSPVLSVDAKYLRMVGFGDTVYVKARIKEYNGIKLTVSYEIISDRTNQVHCKGETKHCFITTKGKPLSLKTASSQFHEMFLKGLQKDKEENE